ncbi:MAG: hypothetical protein DI603_18215 [Roseateles depolymerans]|uniref:Uncharacterized protein n=1 Tax=Roseateles depolymerans TaxID=76731 RepID=A0A2W5FGY8_9BURK|nr:MAG: hypothetical protein DI603_18215 [Roseateles depolymerans]
MLPVNPKHPDLIDLRVHGYCTGIDAEGIPDRGPLVITADARFWEQVMLAFRYLGDEAKPSKGKGRDSYWLKHEVEYWTEQLGGRHYIPNGALIVAAVMKGLTVRRSEFKYSPNAMIGVSVRPQQRPSQQRNKRTRT